MYPVKQLSELANISVRTLHYYDEIGLLKPAHVGKNGYRYYDENAVLRLQQILFYRELGLELTQIKAILDNPTFSLHDALASHRHTLEARRDHINALLQTIDETIAHINHTNLKGSPPMSKKKLFQPFSEEQQKDYEREIRLEYGADKVNESVRRWAAYSKDQKDAILEEGGAIYNEIAQAIDLKRAPQEEVVQALLARWHEHIRYFYEPTLDILRGLGELYNTHPDFIANFHQIHPRLAEFMKEAIAIYVDDLETAEIEQLLAQDNPNSTTHHA